MVTLYPTESVKCLSEKTDGSLSWQYQGYNLSTKLNAANALLLKMKKYVNLKVLRSICFAIFYSYSSYCCLVWAQNSTNSRHYSANCNFTKKVCQNCQFLTIEFPCQSPIKKISILIFQDKICLQNIIFVSKSLNNLSPFVFNTWFSFSSDHQVLHRVNSENFFTRQIDTQ